MYVQESLTADYLDNLLLAIMISIIIHVKDISE